MKKRGCSAERPGRTIALAITLIMVCAPLLLSGEYWGSKRSDKYHLLSCEWAKKISPSNKRVFGSVNEAQAAGYVGCKVCRPPSVDASAGKTSEGTRESGDTSAGASKSRKSDSSGRCQATTKKGTQCKRNAKAGTDYCWQHGG
jgi:methylphosphotriester-DNA--protein-cysteine methyltransferase